MVKCFKCNKAIKSAFVDVDAWETPSNAVAFDGGASFGSGEYDAILNGITVQLVVCDPCLVKAVKIGLAREVGHAQEDQGRKKKKKVGKRSK